MSKYLSVPKIASPEARTNFHRKNARTNFHRKNAGHSQNHFQKKGAQNAQKMILSTMVQTDFDLHRFFVENWVDQKSKNFRSFEMKKNFGTFLGVGAPAPTRP